MHQMHFMFHNKNSLLERLSLALVLFLKLDDHLQQTLMNLQPHHFWREVFLPFSISLLDDHVLHFEMLVYPNP